MADLRQAWRERQGLASSSLPIVTVGPEQALGLAAQLFAASERPAVLLTGDRPGLRDLLEIRIGADLLPSWTIFREKRPPSRSSRPALAAPISLPRPSTAP